MMVVRNTGLDGSIAIRITEIIKRKLNIFRQNVTITFVTHRFHKKNCKAQRANTFRRKRPNVYVMTKGYDNCIVHT